MDLLAPPSGSAGADVSVRPATSADAVEIARVQLVTWRTAYRSVLPAEVLDDWDGEQAEAVWRSAITDPPTRAHGVLVARERSEVVGFAAFGPPDLAPEEHASPDGPTTDIAALLVEPRWGRRGHGSRLLAAVADLALSSGARRLQMWVPAADEVSAGFLETAGWDRDGWVRTLDAGTGTATMNRWHALLPAPGSGSAAS